MQKSIILQELEEFRKQLKSAQGTACVVYGYNRGLHAARINGCCVVGQKTISESEKLEMKQNKKGFTMLELLISVLIIVILASIAWPMYLKAVERSRMSEAVSLLANIGAAQELQYMQTNQFTASYDGLSVMPKGASTDKYCTKGSPVPPTYTSQACGDGNGFVIQLSSDLSYDGGKARALRSAPRELQYAYELERYYANYGTLCTGLNENGKSLCADFCGLDTYTGPCCSTGGMNITQGDYACGAPATQAVKAKEESEDGE